MKNLFGVNRKTGEHDGEKFIVRRVDAETAAKQERLAQDNAAFNRMAGLPKWVNLCGLILLFLGLIFLCGFLEALDEISFAQAWSNAGWCMIVGCAALAIGLIVLFAAVIKSKRAHATPAYRYLQENSQRVAKESYEALGVPASAQKIDVIGSTYRGKEGKEYKENGLSVNHFNTEAAIYCENEALCFAFTDCVFSLPLSHVLRIECIKKRIAAWGWNKDTPMRKGQYKDYKIRQDNAGQIMTKPYYRIVVRDEYYEEFSILIPCYDIQTVLAVTGKNID